LDHGEGSETKKASAMPTFLSAARPLPMETVAGNAAQLCRSVTGLGSNVTGLQRKVTGLQRKMTGLQRKVTARPSAAADL
jgi:hypothetical protein